MDRDARCQNCGIVWASGVKPIWECDNLAQRIEPGEPLPVGECPKCGAFCHYIDKRCGSCDREVVCRIRQEIRDLVINRRFYFGEDKNLINILAWIGEVLPLKCMYYKEEG